MVCQAAGCGKRGRNSNSNAKRITENMEEKREHGERASRFFRLFRLALEQIYRLVYILDAEVAGQPWMFLCDGLVHLPGYAAIAEMSGHP